MKKRIMAILVVIAILLQFGSMVGCKKVSDTGIVAKDSLAGSVVKSYHWGEPPTEEDLKKLDYFTQQTGATVEFVSINYANMEMKYVLDISAGTSPDLLYLTDERFPKYIIKGFGQPLDDYADYFEDGDEFWELCKSKNDYVWDGKVYGGYTEPWPYYIWYNKTMMEENDVKTPVEYYNEGQWNWENMAKIGKALTADTNKDGEIDRWGGQFWKAEPFVIANDSNFFQFENAAIKLTLDDPKTIKALEFMQQASFKDGWMRTSGDWLADFKSGKLGMIMETTWVRNTPLADARFEVDFVPIPLGPDNTTGTTQRFGTTYGICRNAKNPYGALALMKCNWEYGKKNSIRDSKFASLYTEEQLKRLEDCSKNLYTTGFTYGVGELASKHSELFNEILVDGVPVATAVAKATDAWNYEISTMMTDIAMPKIEPFTAPPTLDFEDESYLNEIVFEGVEGDLVGLNSKPEIVSESGVAISGNSLKFSAMEEEPFMMFHLADKYSFPNYHIYEISFDYRVLTDMDEGGRISVNIGPKETIMVGPYSGSVTAIENLKAGDSGKFTGTIDLYAFNEGYTMALIGVNCGDIVIDNFKIVDKKG